MSDREHMPGFPSMPPRSRGQEEWRKLKAEWTHDYGLRRMEDRGVKYEDQEERKPVDAADREPAPAKAVGKPAAGPKLPSPSEIARDNQPYRPQQGRENDHGRGR